jgi:predicted MFS family arabinose efflux permease
MKQSKTPFSRQQVFIIIIISLLQFVVVLDFLIMAPLGNDLAREIHLSTVQFGTAVSVYALGAGIAGIVVAGFADRYSRKKLVLLSVIGFMAGTMLCGIAMNYPLLLIGRIVAGIFGGIAVAQVAVLVADSFVFEQRGQVMSYVQLSFAVCQVAGLPAGIFLSGKWGWQAPFWFIAGLCVCLTFLIWKVMRAVKPVPSLGVNPYQHLLKSLQNKRYRWPFVTTVLLILPAYMFAPYTAQFLVSNVGIQQQDLGTIYLSVGIVSALSLPLIGTVSDRFGKFKTMVAGTALTCIMLILYANFPPLPVMVVALVTAVMYIGLLSRSVPAGALLTAVPSARERGAFLSINSSVQQIGGGLGTFFTGHIISKKDGRLLHFDRVGYCCVASMVLACVIMYFIEKRINRKEIILTLRQQRQRKNLAEINEGQLFAVE